MVMKDRDISVQGVGAKRVALRLVGYGQIVDDGGG